MSGEKQLKISLGCGKEKKAGFVGLDNIDFGWNKIWDGRTDEIPFCDGEADFIEIHNFLEHLSRENWRHIFNECWRVLKPSGVLEIIVPNAVRGLDLALADPTHVSLWHNGSLKYLTGDRPRNADYGFKKWQIKLSIPHPKDKRVDFIQLRPDK